MPTKDLDSRTGRYTVAFRLPPEAGAEQAWLAGDFNDWSTETCPMHRELDGSLLAVVDDLEPGAELRFRYYLGDGAWENDWAADAYVDNEFGGADSLLVLPPVESPPPDVKAPVASNGSGPPAKPKKAAAKKKAAPAKKAAAKKATTKATPVKPPEGTDTA